MGRRGHSTTIGKFAKIHHDRRVSEIRVLGELLRYEQQANEPRNTNHSPDLRRNMNTIAQSAPDRGATVRSGQLPRRRGATAS